jgi:HAD superfamily hydrolase (TIGR01450 family)
VKLQQDCNRLEQTPTDAGRKPQDIVSGPAPDHNMLVGVPGFEPGTSWSQTRRAYQAAPHPVRPDYTTGRAGAPQSSVAQEHSRDLRDFAAFLFDLDGTLTYPTGAVPGAPELVRVVRALGKKVAVVTNNSRLSRRDLAANLRGLGIPIDEPEIVTAVAATARLIAGQKPGARVLAVGSAGLRAELAEHGLVLVQEPPADYVVTGVDPDLSYPRLARAVEAILGGAGFIAVNVDRFVPTETGRMPGAALVVGALQAVVGRPPDLVVGKPAPGLLLEACRVLGVRPADALLIGDSLTSDLRAARAAGTAFGLVLSGVTSAADLAALDDRPDYVFETLAEVGRRLGV